MAIWDSLKDWLSSFVDLSAETIRRIQNLLNWRLVRALGELQILTRASYILLVLVPLLAAVWPAVQMVVNSEGRAVERAAQVLRGTATEIDRAILRARQTVTPLPPTTPSQGATEPALPADVLKRVEDAAAKIEKAAERQARDLEERILADPKLPWTLAAAFFAALFVVAGHLLYQLYAPEPVRLYSWDTFVASRKEEYAKHPTDDAIERAQQYTETRLGRRLHESGRYESEDVLRRLYDSTEEERQSRIADMPRERVRALISWIEDGDSPAPRDYKREILRIAQDRLGTAGSDEHYLQVRRMTTIERGARAEYLRLAGQYPLVTIATFMLYGMAVWIVGLVIKAQSISVAKAAGIDSLLDLFVH